LKTISGFYGSLRACVLEALHSACGWSECRRFFDSALVLVREFRNVKFPAISSRRGKTLTIEAEF